MTRTRCGICHSKAAVADAEDDEGISFSPVCDRCIHHARRLGWSIDFYPPNEDTDIGIPDIGILLD